MADTELSDVTLPVEKEVESGPFMAVAGRHADLPTMGSSLWEVRSNLPGNRIARVSFCIHRS